MQIPQKLTQFINEFSTKLSEFSQYVLETENDQWSQKLPHVVSSYFLNLDSLEHHYSGYYYKN